MLEEDEWDILDKKKLTLTKEQAQQLYMMHKGKDFYDDFKIPELIWSQGRISSYSRRRLA